MVELSAKRANSNEYELGHEHDEHTFEPYEKFNFDFNKNYMFQPENSLEHVTIITENPENLVFFTFNSLQLASNINKKVSQFVSQCLHTKSVNYVLFCLKYCISLHLKCIRFIPWPWSNYISNIFECQFRFLFEHLWSIRTTRCCCLDSLTYQHTYW